MVGVAGKFKGCHTCRERRVSCDNVRPECLRCKKGKRECKGYEKPARFILSGLEERGRCSLQPPRKVPKSGKDGRHKRVKTKLLNQSNSRDERASLPYVVGSDVVTNSTQEYPFDSGMFATRRSQSAWDDFAEISRNGVRYLPQIIAIHAHLDHFEHEPCAGYDKEQACMIRATSMETPGICHHEDDEEFELRAQCLLHLSSNILLDDFLGIQANSYCLFAYQQTPPTALKGCHGSSWKNDAKEPHSVRSQGPFRLRSFPAHQFFARVYRPNAIYAAILDRKATFLAEDEWMTIPWEMQPKTLIDTLFDHVVTLPGILSRADGLLRQPLTDQRCLAADGLLQEFQKIERTLWDWHALVITTVASYPSSSAPSSARSSHQSHTSRYPSAATSPPHSFGSSSPTLSQQSEMVIDAPFLSEQSSHLIFAPTNPYWIEGPEFRFETHLPFQEQYAFRDGHTALAFVHYWAVQALIFHWTAKLHSAATQLQPVSIISTTQTMTLTPTTALASYQHQHQNRHAVDILLPQEVEFHMGTQPESQNTMFAEYVVPTVDINHAAPVYITPTTIVNNIDMVTPSVTPRITRIIPPRQQQQQIYAAMAQSTIPSMTPFQFSQFPPVTDTCHNSLFPVSAPEPSSAFEFLPRVNEVIHDHHHKNPPASLLVQTKPPYSSHLSSSAAPLATVADIDMHSVSGVADPDRYSEAAIIEFADRVCRSLGYTLVKSSANLHPDSLVYPLTVVERLYEELKGETGISMTEADTSSSPENTAAMSMNIAWCAWFREKVLQRKHEIEQVILREREWIVERM